MIEQRTNRSAVEAPARPPCGGRARSRGGASAATTPDDSAHTWRGDIAVRAAPEHVLHTLADVDACELWSPVRFEVDGCAERRLTAGSKLRLSGKLVGMRTCFRVEILEADATRFMLRATGPIDLVADYAVEPSTHGAHVNAAISLCPAHSRRSSLVRRATAALLAAGVLRHALVRIADEAERRAAISGAGGRLERLGEAA